MVMLTTVMQNNRETVYFKEPLPCMDSIKIFSCSFKNSWHTLRNDGSTDESLLISKLLPRHYDLKSRPKEIDDLFDKYNYRQL